MGERAIVRFEDAQGVTCGIYLHWHGEEARDWLVDAAPTMRRGDASYAAARFCGYCHNHISGRLSLGILPPEQCEDSAAVFQDHGMFIVDCQTGQVRHIYGSKEQAGTFHIEMGE